MRALKQKIYEKCCMTLARLIVSVLDTDRVPVGYTTGTAGYTDRELAELYRSIADGCFLIADNEGFFHMAEINAIWLVLNHRYGGIRARQEWTAGNGAAELDRYIEQYGTIMTFPGERDRAMLYMKEHSI